MDLLVTSFETAEALSEFQHDQEVLQALLFMKMSDDQKSEWFAREWGALQAQANSLYEGMIPPQKPFARSFASFAEKNEFDRQREIEFAMHVQRARSQ